jgi:hypothetical protein
MAKPKRSSGGSGLRKNHGPKRHLFHELKPMVHVIAQSGLLSKYYAYESWALACQARGIKNPRKEDFNKFILLKTKKEKDEYYASLKK